MDTNNGLYLFIMDKHNGIYFHDPFHFKKEYYWDLFYGIYFMIMGTFFWDFYKYVIVASSFFSSNLFHGLILVNDWMILLDLSWDNFINRHIH